MNDSSYPANHELEGALSNFLGHSQNSSKHGLFNLSIDALLSDETGTTEDGESTSMIMNWYSLLSQTPPASPIIFQKGQCKGQVLSLRDFIKPPSCSKLVSRFSAPFPLFA